MVYNLSDTNSLANQFIAELRDVNIQGDRMRFRRNLERLGEIMAYEISKTIQYRPKEVETPLGIAQMMVPDTPVVLATILRAGLPMHQGLLRYFDNADNAFISAYRKHHKDGTFEINLEYISCPNLEDCVLIMCDPMLATGASMALAAKEVQVFGRPRHIHFVTAIASVNGLEYLRRIHSQSDIWIGALDEELTARSFIVPGLGDAGDLSFGEKVQE